MEVKENYVSDSLLLFDEYYLSCRVCKEADAVETDRIAAQCLNTVKVFDSQVLQPKFRRPIEMMLKGQ